MQPGASVTGPFAVLEWFDKELKPGAYLLRFRAKMSGNTFHGEDMEFHLPFTVIEQNAGEHTRILKAYYEKISDADYNSFCTKEEFLMLASARSSFAVPFQRALLERNLYPLCWGVIDSLMFSGTVEAAQAIVDFVKVRSTYYEQHGETYTIPTAIRAIYTMRKQGTAEVITVTDPVVGRCPCPKEPMRPVNW